MKAIAQVQLGLHMSGAHTKTSFVKYEVSAIDGTGKATFTKKSGETGTLVSGPYTATYGEAPSTSQTYTATDGVQNVTNLPMSANSSTTSLTFTVSCGLLKVTLNQTGISISSIAVSDGTSTYTLTCSSAVSIASGATFYIAVPAGTYTSFKFTESNGYVSWRSPLTIAVEANHIKPVTSTFGPEYKVDETVYGYGSKINGYWWAPVNCGYEPATTSPAYSGYPYGKLYQWGRGYGQGYTTNYDATTPTTTTCWTGTNGNEDSNTFYRCSSGATYYYDWIKNGSNYYWNSAIGDNGPDKTTYDPCPTGWRVPTYAELNALTGNKGSKDLGSAGWDSTNTGYWFNGSTSPKKGEGLLLRAAGYRDCSTCKAIYRGSNGRYWSSSVNGYCGRCLWFSSSKGAYMSDDPRAYGYSVRCVQVQE